MDIFNNPAIILHILLHIPPNQLEAAVLGLGKKGLTALKHHLFRKWYERKWFSFFRNASKVKYNKDYISYHGSRDCNYVMLPKKHNMYRYMSFVRLVDTERFVSIMITKDGILKFGSLTPSSSKEPYYKGIDHVHRHFLKKHGKEWWYDENETPEACEDFAKTLVLHEAWLYRPWLTERQILG